jgi:hypothetical protein
MRSGASRSQTFLALGDKSAGRTGDADTDTGSGMLLSRRSGPVWAQERLGPVPGAARGRTDALVGLVARWLLHPVPGKRGPCYRPGGGHRRRSRSAQVTPVPVRGEPRRHSS